METVAWIYILTNRYNTTLYVGATNDLPTRMWEHKTRINASSFTARYNIFKLIYFEAFGSAETAFEREKTIKGKSRAWKEALIATTNPEWNDLSDTQNYS